MLLCLSSPSRADGLEHLYRAAARHYAEDQWQLAVSRFRSYLDQSTDGNRVDSARFYLGESLVQLGKIEEARAVFRRYIDRSPQDGHQQRGLFRLGETGYLLGNHIEADTVLRTFTTRFPDDPMNAYALAYLGDIALQAGNSQLAEQRYQMCVEQFPKGALAADSHLRLGLIRYRSDDFPGASQRFSEICDKFPTSNVIVNARYWLSRTDLRQGQFSRAAAELAHTAASNPDHALAAACTYYCGEAYRRTADLREAMKRYEHGLQRWPRSHWADDCLCSMINIALATGDQRLPNWSRRFREEFSESPRTIDVLTSTGRYHLKHGQYREASVALDDLVRQQQRGTARLSETMTTWYLLGLARLGEQRYSEAVNILGRIRLDQVSKELAASVLVARASGNLSLEKHDQASVLLRRYLQEHPDGTDEQRVRSDLALALIRQDQTEKALNIIEPLLDASPPVESERIGLMLADNFYSHRQFEPARRLYTWLSHAETRETRARALACLGWSLLKSGKANLATTTFEQFMAEFDDHPKAQVVRLAWGRSLEQMRRWTNAIEVYRQVYTRPTKTVESAHAMQNAARLLNQLGQHREAVTLYEQLINGYPDSPRADTSLYQLAWSLVDAGQRENANAVFTRIHGQHPESHYWSDATYRVAERAAKNENFVAAERLLQEVIDRADQRVTPNALFLIGQVYIRQGQWAQVELPLRKLVAETSDDSLRSSGEYWLAESLYRRNQFDRAEQLYAKLEGNPSIVNKTWKDMVTLRLGQTFAVRKEWLSAAGKAKSILQNNPDFQQAFEAEYLLGRCLAALGKFSKARQHYRRVGLSPNGKLSETAAMAQWMIGETFFHQRDFKNAIPAYRRVELLYPFPRWRAAALLQAGKCHEKQQEWPEAITLYSRLLNDYPEKPFSSEAQKRLAIAQQQTRENQSSPVKVR